jgi:hypothetical protein
MRIRHLQNGSSRLMPVLSVVILVVICSSTSTAAVRSASRSAASQHVSSQRSTSLRSSLAGTWSGRYSGAFSGTFRLQWKQYGSTLRGSIKLSNPSGTYGISGKVHGRAISFGAVGVGATYTGSVSGTTMSGRYNTPQGGGHWSARKIS